MLKGLGDLGKMGGILKQAMEMKSRIEELKANLGNLTVEFAVGGDMVKVVMNGNMELVSLKISPELFAMNDPEMVEAMVHSAVNGVIAKAQDLVKSKMTELTGNVDIPGLI